MDNSGQNEQKMDAYLSRSLGCCEPKKTRSHTSERRRNKSENET